MQTKTLYLLALYAQLSLAAETTPIALVSPQSEQSALAVTIYNENLALVKDQRKLALSAGLTALSMRDVSAMIKPETALLRSLMPQTNLAVLEQNFDYDLLSPQKLLEKHVGQPIHVIKTNPQTGVETEEAATVLSAQHGVVLQYKQRIETGIAGRLSFASVPGQLKDRPTLTTLLQYQGNPAATLELSYLTAGLQWRADYVAELNQQENALDLSAWVTLTNTSGTAYPNAKVQLVAGDVNRVREAIQPKAMMMRTEAVFDAAPALPTEQALLEYHLYTLPRLTSIADQQTKQVALLSATQVPAKKTLSLMGADYYYQGAYQTLNQKQKVDVFVQFDNNEASKLGLPLPKGIMRVYKKDLEGNAQFVGEDQLDHTAKNAPVRLKLGQAFDVTADRVQTDFKQLGKPNSPTVFESAYNITLHNAKKEPVVVTVQEPINGDWKMLKTSQPLQKLNAHLVSWQVKIPAESDTTLSYRVQVKY